MPRVCPGTSVILAPVVTLPKRRSSDCDSARLPSIIDGLSISVCHVNGSACHAMSPRAMASSIVLRSAGRSLLQILEEQPRAGASTHSAACRRRSRRAQSRWPAGRTCSKYLVHDVVLRIDESGIEVALEHHQHALHARIRCGGLRSRCQRGARPQRHAHSRGCHRLHKIAALHRRTSSRTNQRECTTRDLIRSACDTLHP